MSNDEVIEIPEGPPFLWSLGIDPGKSGATVVLNLTDLSWSALRHNMIGRDKHGKYFKTNMYLSLVAPMLPRENLETLRVFIEKPMILSAQRGADSIGINWGKLAGAFDTAGIDYEVISASQWKNDLMTRDLRSEHKKNASVVYVEALGFKIPTLKPNGTVKDHNVADALAIALWGARKKLGLPHV